MEKVIEEKREDERGGKRELGGGKEERDGGCSFFSLLYSIIVKL